MTKATRKTSALVVTAPRALTDGQRRTIRDNIASQLPIDVGVLVFDAGFTVRHIGHVGPELDLVVGELQSDYTSAEILAELKALRDDIDPQRKREKLLSTRITDKRMPL